MVHHRFAMRSAYPVSYTHLDVYKRQGIKCAASPIIVMGNGRLLFHDLSKGNIRVANPTKDDVKRISSL